MNVFEEIDNVEDFFNECKRHLELDNRFFVEEKFIKCLDEIAKCSSFVCCLNKESFLYRGRIYNKENDKPIGTKAPQFEGFDAEDSGVNRKKSPAPGRMNPEGIMLLYTATSELTCAKELGAAAGEIVSIAKAAPIKNLSIADFPGCESRIRNKKKKSFIKLINNYLSSGYGSKDYIFTQFIAMYCKYKGFDGIKYRSKYANKTSKKNGMNIAVFDPDNCVFSSSKLKTVKQVSLEFEK